MFSCEYCEIFKSTYFEEHLWTAASALWWKLSIIAISVSYKFYKWEADTKLNKIMLITESTATQHTVLRKLWFWSINHFPETVARRCSVKKVLSIISQNSQESTCQSLLFIKLETLAQVFSCEFRKIFKNTFFYRTPLVAASYFRLVKPSYH